MVDPWSSHGSHGRSMVDPWSAHGWTMVDPLSTRGRPIADPWSHGRPRVDPWSIHGRPIVDPCSVVSWSRHCRILVDPFVSKRSYSRNTYASVTLMSVVGCSWQRDASLVTLRHGLLVWPWDTTPLARQSISTRCAGYSAVHGRSSMKVDQSIVRSIAVYQSIDRPISVRID